MSPFLTKTNPSVADKITKEVPKTPETLKLIKKFPLNPTPKIEDPVPAEEKKSLNKELAVTTTEPTKMILKKLKLPKVPKNKFKKSLKKKLFSLWKSTTP